MTALQVGLLVLVFALLVVMVAWCLLLRRVKRNLDELEAQLEQANERADRIVAEAERLEELPDNG